MKRSGIVVLLVLLGFWVLLCLADTERPDPKAVCSQEEPVIVSTVDSTKEDLKAGIVAYIQHKNRTVYPKLAADIAEAVVRAADRYGIPEKVLLALMEVESTFRYNAVSSSGAIGLMQVHKGTWFSNERDSENLIKAGIVDSVNGLYDPAKNIMAGAYILNIYYRQALKDNAGTPMKEALTAYYGGETNGHYAKTCKRLGEFFIFHSLTTY